MRTTLLRCVIALTLSVGAGFSRAEDWPSCAGPTGQGFSQEKNLPLTWGGKDQEHVLWKTPLPGNDGKAKQDQNQSSPIVSHTRVFVTTSYWPAELPQKGFPEHHVLCFQTSDGKQLWDTMVAPGPWKLTDLRGGYTAPTPASDGERVYVLFGSAVLAALDFDGKIVWRQEITPYAYDVAIGNSPIVFGDSVLLICDQLAAKSRLLAFDRKTGTLKWEEKRPKADWTHSTPVIVHVNGKPQLLVAGASAVQGLDPASGKVLWWCAAPGNQRIGDTPSPVYGAGLVFCDSGRGGPGIAVDPTGAGDVTKTHFKWKISPIPSGFSSPVIVGDYLVRLHSPATLKCWKLATGEPVFSERLEGVETASSPFVTPDGHIYLASSGKSYVVKAGPMLEVLALNDLGDASQASPAVADGRIFFKGRRFLYGIGKK